MQANSVQRQRRVVLFHPERLYAGAISDRLQQEGLIVHTTWPLRDVEVGHALRLFDPDIIVTALATDPAADQPFPLQLLRSHDAPVLVIVPPDEMWAAIRAIDSGAIGFTTTQHSLDDLAIAVQRGLAGEELHGRADLETLRRRQSLDDERRKRRMNGLMSLSLRETEILSDLMDGLTPEPIARSRAIAISTVRTHVKRILIKLKVSSQLEAVAHARQKGWRPPRSRPLAVDLTSPVAD